MPTEMKEVLIYSWMTATAYVAAGVVIYANLPIFPIGVLVGLLVWTLSNVWVFLVD